MIPHALLTEAGVLPIKNGPIRFAVGAPDGLTSNAWRVWLGKAGDVYIACRDNFKEAKVSLHTSGRWRMAFTTEAIAKNRFLPSDQNRAWEVWDEPPTTLLNTVIAFRLIFLTSELAVRPEQRAQKQWHNVVHIEASPPGKVTTVTLFVTNGDLIPEHESEPSFCLASLGIGSGRHVQLITHGDPEGEWPARVAKHIATIHKDSAAKGITFPKEAYAYLFGRGQDGARFLLGARMSR